MSLIVCGVQDERHMGARVVIPRSATELVCVGERDEALKESLYARV